MPRLLQKVADAVGGLLGTKIIVHLNPAESLVALTIDDGPSPATTPGLLQVLAAHQAQATFFVIGERSLRHPALIAEIVAQGHELGNHLMRDEPSALLGRQEFERQLNQVHDFLASYAEIRLFRPGSGWFTPRMLRSAARLGYQCALGSPHLVVLTYADPAVTAAGLASRCTRGSVIVLHEGTLARSDVIEVLDRLLDALDLAGIRATSLAGLQSVQ